MLRYHSKCLAIPLYPIQSTSPDHTTPASMGTGPNPPPPHSFRTLVTVLTTGSHPPACCSSYLNKRFILYKPFILKINCRKLPNCPPAHLDAFHRDAETPVHPDGQRAQSPKQPNDLFLPPPQSKEFSCLCPPPPPPTLSNRDNVLIRQS